MDVSIDEGTKSQAPNPKFLYTTSVFYFWIATGVAFVGSILTKLIADAYLTERIAIVGSFIGLHPVANDGVAFGLKLPSGIQELAIVLALVFVTVLAFRSDRRTGTQIGFGMIVGGALGNVADRFRDGIVTDFFQIGSFPVFNVADSCITLGVALLLLMQLRQR